MTIAEAILLGVIQGLTEFLPVSSSAHLVMGQALLGIDLPGVLFEVSVHVATLCAVAWVYRRRLGSLLRGLLVGERASVAYVGLLALATVPAAVVGFTWADQLASAFEKPVAAAAFLLVTGGLVWSLRVFAPRATREAPRARDALAVGVAQAVAILPGISRSGSTVAAGTALGVAAGRMAEFSFLMSIPAIGGAALLQIPEASALTGSIGAWPLLAGFLTAAVSGVVAIRIFVRMLERRTFHRFAYYCWAVGIAYLLAAWVWPALR